MARDLARACNLVKDRRFREKYEIVVTHMVTELLKHPPAEFTETAAEWAKEILKGDTKLRKEFLYLVSTHPLVEEETHPTILAEIFRRYAIVMYGSKYVASRKRRTFLAKLKPEIDPVGLAEEKITLAATRISTAASDLNMSIAKVTKVERKVLQSGAALAQLTSRLESLENPVTEAQGGIAPKPIGFFRRWVRKIY